MYVLHTCNICMMCSIFPKECPVSNKCWANLELQLIPRNDCWCSWNLFVKPIFVWPMYFLLHSGQVS